MVPVATDEPSPSLLSFVPDFFAWSPTSEVIEKTITGRSATRPPAFWDRHLHENFVLKKVVSAPDLTSRLGEIADSALKEARASLLNHCKPDQLSEKMKSLGTACIKNTKFESEVRDFYKESIAPPCLAAAGALGFGTVGDFLKWQPKLYRQPPQAIADGFLIVAADGSLPDEFKLRIELLEKLKLNVLAIWEFKSLAAGSNDIMGAIQGLSSQESFSWTECTPRNPCNSKRCHSPLPYTGRKSSPDFLVPFTDSQLNVAKCSPDVITGFGDTADHLPDFEDGIDEDISPEDDILENEARSPSSKGPQVKSKHIIQQVGFTTVSVRLHAILIICL